MPGRYDGCDRPAPHSRQASALWGLGEAGEGGRGAGETRNGATGPWTHRKME